MTGAPEEIARIWAEIAAILKRGNDAEVKRVRGQIVVVEITRRVRVKPGSG